MKLSPILRESDWKVTATMVLTKKGYKLINVEPYHSFLPLIDLPASPSEWLGLATIWRR
jgi:hypothetical protein